MQGDPTSSDRDEFWATLPEKALHPLRVPIVEALRWIGEPLSAIGVVDVLDGHMSMCDAGHHLRALTALGVTEPAPIDADSRRRRDDLFDVPYRLTEGNPANDA